MSKITVRPIKLSDRAAWNVLWNGYVKFYKGKVSKDVIECVWWRLHDATSPVNGIAAVKDNKVVGIAHYVLSPHTWSRNYICYLEDIFVSSAARRQGAAQAMIKWLHAEANRKGWQRLYWQTDASNTAAQGLYERIAQRTRWVRYDMDLSKPVKK